MLNLNKNNKVFLNEKNYKSFSLVTLPSILKVFSFIILSVFLVNVIFLFLPWTQNIRANGTLTTFEPDKRPQTINSVIGGKIEKWFVLEGDYVEKGDTILFISEIKDDYFNPDLISNMQKQINAKEQSLLSYSEKLKQLQNQFDALNKNLKLKLEQSLNKIKQMKLKVNSDSIDFEVAKVNYNVAEDRLKRMEVLYEKGLKSQTDFESRKINLQQAQSKIINAENDLLSSRNELINTQIEYNSINNDFTDKLSKVQSDIYSTQSAQFEVDAEVNKMKNSLSNYSIRSGYYYITSPQSGYITKALQAGIGDIIKEGEQIVSIMPENYNLLVELYIEPINLPLIQKGQHVRLIFDGWPSIVFSGWPNSSVGTFGGEVYTYDNFISDNGKYRVLIKQDANEIKWPKQLRVGSGAIGMMLLRDVPIWYELWRQINGFPPDFYTENNGKVNSKEVKSK